MDRLSIPFGSLSLMLSLAVVSCSGDGASAPVPSTSSTPKAANGHTQSPTYTGSLPLDQLNLPAGYAIDVFAEGLVNARSIKYAGDGLVFVSTRSEGSVYAVQDTNADMRADLTYTLASELQMPNGVALRGDDLYVATVNQILRFADIRTRLDAPGDPEVVYDGYPTETHHGWKFIAFGPDELLYVPVGAPCNICDEEGYATITRLDVTATSPEPEVVARGVRNTVGFTWHPTTQELWFTDNGRDRLGDDVPPCELNRLPADLAATPAAHYGYPYFHGGDIRDPEFGDQRQQEDYQLPAQNLGPHVAPLGVEFAADDFGLPTSDVLIAEHGSWNRTDPIGYRITKVPTDDAGQTGAGYEVFIDGWLQADGPWGRPVDLEWMPDGSLLISDDFADVIYRVYRNS